MKGRIPAASGRRGCQTGAAGAKDRTASGTSVHGLGIHAPMSAHWAPAPWRNRPAVRASSAPTHPRTRPPLRHHPAPHLCDRPLVCGACLPHTSRTPAAHPATVPAAVAVAPQARPTPHTNASYKRHRQTHHTSTAARRLPMAWAVACGPATAAAPVVCPTGAHMHMGPWQRPRRSIPAPCHAGAAPCPTRPCTALYRP